MKRLLFLLIFLAGCDVYPEEWKAAVKACDGLGGLKFYSPSTSPSPVESFGKATCKNGARVYGAPVTKEVP